MMLMSMKQSLILRRLGMCDFNIFSRLLWVEDAAATTAAAVAVAVAVVVIVVIMIVSVKVSEGVDM